MKIEPLELSQPLGFAVETTMLQKIVLSMPQLTKWSELDRLFADMDNKIVRLDWQLPGIGCVVVGGDARQVIPAMAAMACLQISIILVDDLLDEEPDGTQHRMGIGRTANLALALQASSHLLIEQCDIPAENRAAAALSLTRMALDTAAGQELDVSNLVGEENYWQVVRAKSTPFYGAGLEAGARLAGAAAEVAAGLYEIGVIFGEAVQILDDLEDAFKIPANADWLQGRNNLAILYGLTAEYPEKETFLQLKANADQLESLEQAQQLLIKAGAVSYCAYQLLQRHWEARRRIRSLSLQRPALLQNLLTAQLLPFLKLLERLDTELPDMFLSMLQVEKDWQ
ncbi:MAG: polyprenyl synthetase family protein [Caldilineaceae bacterium]|nr:polyprenyl synthetase family protein [Caldilineaceae bacterium]